MKIFITGGAGCIGSKLAEKLLEDDNNMITVFDNMSSGKEEHISQMNDNNRFSFIEGDILDKVKIEESMKGHDIVFHLAANPDIKYKEGSPTDKDFNQNVIGTYNILEAMRKNSIKEIIFSSTSAIYGIPNKLPTSEEYGPNNPISLYGSSKLCCEALISGFCGMFDIHSWIFRFANIVGPRTRKKGTMVIHDFIAKLKSNPNKLEILGDGKQSKPYMYVDDCVDGMLFAYRNSSDSVNTFNLGPDDKVSVDEIAQLIMEEMGLENVEFSYTGKKQGWAGDVSQVFMDVSKINKMGWRTTHTSKNAIKMTVKKLLSKS
ncbi:NAD-dependent epimerase/dehydratase family protein [Candidatus Aenigmatarchaeota archaeon]